MTKINIVCKKCGSNEVFKDAYAEWDPEKQQWVLHAVYDYTTCNQCGTADAAKEVLYVKANKS